MKKYLLLIACLIVGALAIPATANAWIQVGPCELHAYYPIYTQPDGYVVAEGQVDSCSYNVHIKLQVCTQSTTFGPWQTDSNTCSTGENSGYTGLLTWYDKTEVPLCGVWYRAWTWTYINDIQGDHWSNTYVGDANYKC